MSIENLATRLGVRYRRLPSHPLHRLGLDRVPRDGAAAGGLEPLLADRLGEQQRRLGAPEPVEDLVAEELLDELGGGGHGFAS
jgi:hypothetical protein